MAVDVGKTQVIDFREVGASGLRRFSGFIYDEFLQELTGWRGIAIYKEMMRNDATVAAVLNSIRMLCRKVPWMTQAASTQPYDEEAADFLETCMNDMSDTWADTVDAIFSFLGYGFSVHEICYKRRCGDVFDPTMRSKHSDGRIGWRKVPIRSQDSIYRWQFDDHGGIQGVEQLAPPHYYHVTIPIEKFLLFRTTTEKNNPEGLSIFRGAYRDWYLKKNIENIEGIGIERDLAGLPYALVPPEILSSGADQNQRNLLASLQQIIVNIRRDAQEGVIFPMAYDSNGKEMFKLGLLSTGGQRQFDTDKIIQRYDRRIAMTALADFLFLGQQQVGSFALASSKTNIFATATGAYLDIIADVFNRYAIPRLFALNDFRISDYPKITHGDLESVDLNDLGNYIQKLAASGYPLFPNADLEKYLMKVANLPEPPDELKDVDMQVEPTRPEYPDSVFEIPGVPVQTPTGLAKPADTTPVNQKPPVAQVFTNASGNTETNTNQDNAYDTYMAEKNQRRINLDY
jgi:hypothetical protein